jgi:seryl-tRNA synthetase
MIDPQLLRKDIQFVAEQLSHRKFVLDVTAYTDLETQRKACQARAEEFQAKRNQFAKLIGMKKAKGEDASPEMRESATCNEQLAMAASELEKIQKSLADFVMGIPNLPHESVPVGKDENDNQEIMRWGNVPSFDFAIKDHVDLGALHGLDFESGTKITGSRFVVLKGTMARLHRALAQ